MKRRMLLMCLLVLALCGCGGGDDNGVDPSAETLGPKQDNLVLTPTEATRVMGGAIQYEARAHYEDGTTVNITDRCTFSSADPTVASFPGENKKGEATAHAAGKTTIQADCPDDFMAEANLTVTADIVDFVFSPKVHELYLHIPKKFCAYVIDSAGNKEEVCDETSYTIDDPDILRHNGEGYFEGLLPGTTTVTGEFQAGPGQTYTASATAEVSDTQPTELIVEYPPVNIPVNSQERVRVFAVYPDAENPLPVRGECTSDNPSVARCSYDYGDLHIVGVGRGAATFTIEWQGLTDTFELSVGSAQ